MKEVESKFQIDDFSPIVNKLSTLGAKYLGRFLQTDTFFDKSGEIVASGGGLRIRNLQKIASLPAVLSKISSKKLANSPELDTLQSFSQITYKGPVEENLTAKVRAEFESEVSDPAMMTKILGALGYKPVVTIQKRRSKFLLQNAHIELDELPMIGFFIEIEAESVEAVDKIAKTIGIKAIHVKRSYLHLLQKKAHQIGKPVDKILF